MTDPEQAPAQLQIGVVEVGVPPSQDGHHRFVAVLWVPDPESVSGWRDYIVPRDRRTDRSSAGRRIGFR